MQTIQVTEHDKNEWSRMAKAAYAADRNDVGHTFSMAATLFKGEAMPIARFDELQGQYRTWLCFNEFPKAAA